jgi:hypothetical protein
MAPFLSYPILTLTYLYIINDYLFSMPNPDSIVIMRVSGAKMAPLTSKEIEKAFKRRLQVT